MVVLAALQIRHRDRDPLPRRREKAADPDHDIGDLAVGIEARARRPAPIF